MPPYRKTLESLNRSRGGISRNRSQRKQRKRQGGQEVFDGINKIYRMRGRREKFNRKT
jgi:hypothetical protein